MSNFGFGFASFSITTTLGGSATTSVKIPGTFGGIQTSDPTQGRYLKSVTVWCDAPSNGDQITLLQIVDTDGVVPVPARAAFPNYPVIFDMLDTVGGVQSLLLASTPVEFDAFDTSGVATSRFLPSQLYLKVTFQAGDLSIGKIMRAVIRWGIWQ